MIHILRINEMSESFGKTEKALSFVGYNGARPESLRRYDEVSKDDLVKLTAAAILIAGMFDADANVIYTKGYGGYSEQTWDGTIYINYDNFVPKSNVNWRETIERHTYENAIKLIESKGCSICLYGKFNRTFPALKGTSVNKMGAGDRIEIDDFEMDETLDGWSNFLNKNCDRFEGYIREQYIPQNLKQYASITCIESTKDKDYPKNDIHGNPVKYAKIRWIEGKGFELIETKLTKDEYGGSHYKIANRCPVEIKDLVNTFNKNKK